jgi:hypothetical protein
MLGYRLKYPARFQDSRLQHLLECDNRALEPYTKIRTEGAMPELKLNIDDKFDKALQDLVNGNDEAKTKADVVQRAVATYQYFRDIPKDQKIQVVDSAGHVIESDLKVP